MPAAYDRNWIEKSQALSQPLHWNPADTGGRAMSACREKAVAAGVPVWLDQAVPESVCAESDVL